MRARAGLRARRSFAALAIAALAAAGLTAAAGAVPAGATAGHAARAGPVAGEFTIAHGNLRTGWDRNEPALTPAAVGGGHFGQIFSTPVNGQVYAQPLVIGGTLIVATENDWVYGLDASTGAVLWKTSLGPAYHITSCGDITPNIGVTSTGVYDPSTSTVYVMGLVHEINWAWQLFGLNVTTGAITFKQQIAGHPANDSHLSFSALPEGQRAGLTLLNGWVYASFGSHCDHGSYNGYVAGVRPSTHSTTLWADETGVTNAQGGIWHSGGGIMSDGSGRIFVTSSNGISPAGGPGNKPPGQLADSVIRLSVNSTTGVLSARDFFSPANAPTLDASNLDLGSGGPSGLPFGTTTYPHELMQAGKDGRIFILNRDNLGGRKQGPGGSDQDLAEAGPYAPQFSSPAFFADTPTLTAANAPRSHDYMLYVGKDDFMREFQFGVNGSDAPTLKNVANSRFTIGYTSGPPAITSNGIDPSTALIWEIHNADKTGAGAYLSAWDLLPQPRSGGGVKLAEIFAAPIGTASRFTKLATDNGMVYVGTRDGHVLGFGMTSGAALTRSGTAQFRDTPAGSSSVGHVTLTATRTVTVTGASVGAASTPVPFTLAQVTVTQAGSSTAAGVNFPITLHEGDVLRAAVTFAPAASGGASGVVSFTTAGSAVPVSVPLIADGTSTGLSMSSPGLSFVLVEQDGMLITNVPVGIVKPLVTDIVNTGSKPVRVTAITLPAGPFKAVNLPTIGTVIKPGEALPVELRYSPTQAVTSDSSLTVTASRGTSATVALTGTGLPPVTRFSASPGVVNFGSVPVGHTATAMVHVTEVGNQPSLMQRSPLPGGPFGAPLRAASGLPLKQGDDLLLPVTFRPAKAGSYHGVYTVTWTDRFGRHSLEVPISGTGVG